MRLYLLPMLGTKRLESLSPADVRAFLTRLTRQTTAATAKESHRVLRSALTSACREELISRNVVSLVDPPAVEPRLPAPWTLAETLRFLDRGERRSALCGIHAGPRAGFASGGDRGLAMGQHRPRQPGHLRAATSPARPRRPLRRRSEGTPTPPRAAAAHLHGRRCAGSGSARPRSGRQRGSGGKRRATSSQPGPGVRSRRVTSTGRSGGVAEKLASRSSDCTTPATAAPPC